METNFLSFDELMKVVNGEATRKGQSGLETAGAAQMYYFGSRFGKDLDVEALAKKVSTSLEEVRRYATNLQTIKDGIQEELDKAIAEKIEKRASQFENFSVENLDAMMAKLQAMKAAKIA